jgi:hypothetical protein
MHYMTSTAMGAMGHRRSYFSTPFLMILSVNVYHFNVIVKWNDVGDTGLEWQENNEH